MNRIQIKENAKVALGGNIFSNIWLSMLLVFLIQGVLISAVTSLLYGIASLIITGPLAYGISYILLKKIRTTEKVNFTDIFKGFKDDFGQNFALGLLSSLFVFLWSLLLIVPGIIKSYSYSMAFYIKTDHPEYDWKKCLDESIRITNGHKLDLFVLDLSFIGWYFVGTLCFGIGSLWVAPYHQTSIAMYYEQLKSSSSQEL